MWDKFKKQIKQAKTSQQTCFFCPLKVFLFPPNFESMTKTLLAFIWKFKEGTFKRAVKIGKEIQSHKHFV